MAPKTDVEKITALADWLVVLKDQGAETQWAGGEGDPIADLRQIAANLEKQDKQVSDLTEDLDRMTRENNELRAEIACPDCGCCTPEDAEAAECGCDSVICMREGTLVEEVIEFRRRFDLYVQACQRGIDLWRKEDPESRELVRPDQGALVAWLLRAANEAGHLDHHRVTVESLASPEFDADGYPTERTEATIAQWGADDATGLMEFVAKAWKYPEWFKQVGENDSGHIWEVSTGGWSGNESLIYAMQANLVFWMVCWAESSRGGHYQFVVPFGH
jgi:hypothetical protein